jgi:hypothetical protein
MMRELQTYYAMIPVELILYNDHGKMVSTSEAIESETYKSSQVYTKYKNGFCVYVNRDQKNDWAVDCDRQKYILPPNGYLASKPGEFLEYSCLINGKRVDYVSGKSYTYCDGRSERTKFGPITAANSYIIRKESGSTWLMPVPFVKEESVFLAGDFGKAKTSFTAYDQDGKKLNIPLETEITRDGIKIRVDGRVFKYEIK